MGKIYIIVIIFLLVISYLLQSKNFIHIATEWTRICPSLSLEFWNYFHSDKFCLLWRYFLCFTKYFLGFHHFLVHVTISPPALTTWLALASEMWRKYHVSLTNGNFISQCLICHPTLFYFPQQQEICAPARGCLSVWVPNRNLCETES